MDGFLEEVGGLIERLLEGRKKRGKCIQLIEPEIRRLCVVAKQIFLAQPNLLELEAPINICGNPMFLPIFLCNCGRGMHKQWKIEGLWTFLCL